MIGEDELVDLYRKNRKNGRLQEDLKIQEVLTIEKGALKHIKGLKKYKINKMMEAISKITIEFPKDTICLRYAESQQNVVYHDQGIALKIYMTYHIFRCPNR